MTGSGPRAACETMIGLANDRGGRDNQTAIVADLLGDGLEPPDEFETVTSTYEVLQAFEAKLDSAALGTMVGAPAAAATPDRLPDLPVEPAARSTPAAPKEVSSIAVGTVGETQHLPRSFPPTWWTGAVVAAIVVLLVVVLFVLAR